MTSETAGWTWGKERAVAALREYEPSRPGHILTYRGEPVDETWPADALVAMVRQMNDQLETQRDNMSKERELLSAFARRR